MSMGINPIDVANALRDSYLRYLETSFHLKDPSLRNQFRELLHDKTLPPLVRTPILEVAPGFKTGKSIDDLIAEGLIANEFRTIYRYDFCHS